MEMGCCSSAYADNDDKTKYKHANDYVATSNKTRASKRNYFPHISNGSSSGYSSACTSPSRPSLLSRKVKAKNLISKYKSNKQTSGIIAICDDFHEAMNIQAHQENKSFGYYSESLSTEGSVSTSSQSCLRRIQATSSRSKVPLATVAPTPSSMEMDMYMVSRCQRITLKTSSPIFHRSVTYDAACSVSPLSRSYQKWAKCLQTTHTCIRQNVSDIPEAIAGNFSPLNFPAFTDLEEMESAAKRFKVDIYQKHMSTQSRLITTLTTDL